MVPEEVRARPNDSLFQAPSPPTTPPYHGCTVNARLLRGLVNTSA
jgi:hypothetical protein